MFVGIVVGIVVVLSLGIPAHDLLLLRFPCMLPRPVGVLLSFVPTVTMVRNIIIFSLPFVERRLTRWISVVRYSYRLYNVLIVPCVLQYIYGIECTIGTDTSSIYEF